MIIKKHGFKIVAVRGGFWLWLLNRMAANAVCMVWGTAYVRHTHLSQRICRHEFEHWRQMQREGRLRMMLNYMIQNYKHGYENNPYEIEARLVQYRRDYIFMNQ